MVEFDFYHKLMFPTFPFKAIEKVTDQGISNTVTEATGDIKTAALLGLLAVGVFAFSKR